EKSSSSVFICVHLWIIPMQAPRTIEWIGGPDGFLRLIDQTLLPTRLEYRDCRTAEEGWEAIKTMRVRGAPSIGVAAAYGVVLAVQRSSLSGIPSDLETACDFLGTARPTAVNLFWALERMRQLVRRKYPVRPDLQTFRPMLLKEAQAIEEEDR